MLHAEPPHPHPLLALPFNPSYFLSMNIVQQNILFIYISSLFVPSLLTKWGLRLASSAVLQRIQRNCTYARCTQSSSYTIIAMVVGMSAIARCGLSCKVKTVSDAAAQRSLHIILLQCTALRKGRCGYPLNRKPLGVI